MGVKSAAARALLVLLVVTLVGLTACSTSQPERFCTVAGCQTGVGFDLFPLLDDIDNAVPIDVRTCVREVCAVHRLDWDTAGGRHTIGASLFRGAPLTEVGRVPVAVTVTGADGAVILTDTGSVPIQRNQPNGPTCPPTCFGGDVTVSQRRGLEAR